jgi:hypothetical protein
MIRPLLERPGAVDLATAHGHRDLLLDIATDPALPPRSRQRALEALGWSGTRVDLDDLLAVAVSDPLLLAGPAMAALGIMHRRGHFVADDGVPVVVWLAVAGAGTG